MASLLDIPKDVFTHHILPELGFEDRIVLRQVAKAFRCVPEDENQKDEFIKLLQFVENRDVFAVQVQEESDLSDAIKKRGNKKLEEMRKCKLYKKGFKKRYFISSTFLAENFDYFDMRQVATFPDLDSKIVTAFVKAIAPLSSVPLPNSFTPYPVISLLRTIFEKQKATWNNVDLVDYVLMNSPLSSTMLTHAFHCMPDYCLQYILLKMNNKHLIDWKYVSQMVILSTPLIEQLKDYLDFEILVENGAPIGQTFVTENWHLFRTMPVDSLEFCGIDVSIASRNKKRKLKK